MKTSRFHKFALGAVLALGVAGPAMAVDLRIGMQDDPDALDPAQSRTFASRLVYTSLCDKLVDISKDVQIVPQLATDWKLSDDGLTLVMNLVKDAVFHDGTPFNAEAAAYNIMRSKTLPESVRKSELASIDTVEASGPYQITIKLKKPDASLLSQFSDRAGMMVSPAAAKEAGAKLALKPICSGPYRFVERIQQDRIVLEKFPQHRDAKNYHFDKLTFLPLPDSTVRLTNLRSGDLDLIERMAATDAGTAAADPNLKVVDVTSLGYISIYMNVGNGERAKTPIGQDKRIRQAFSKAIDRKALVQIVYDGKATPGNQPFPPSSIWYNKKYPVEERDIKGAKALLAAAGQKRVEVELQHPNNPVVTQMMQVIQAMTAEAGFDVKLRATEFATLLSEQRAGKYELSRMNWSGRPDPDGSIHQFVTCGAGLNDTRYCNKDVDAALNAARTVVDYNKRKALYDTATATLVDELPIIYLAHESYVYGMKKGVMGFELYPDGMIRLAGVTLKK